MHQSAWQKELFRVGALVSTGLAAGWSVGYPTVGLLTGLTVSQLVSLHAAQALYRWSYRLGPPPQDSGYVGYSVDKLLRREKQLRARLAKQAMELQRYNQGIESLQDGVLILDQEGFITTINGAAIRLLSLRKDDAGQHVKNLIRHPLFVRYFDQGDFREALQFDMRKFSLQLQITEFGYEQKVMLVRDVTERKRVESMRQNFIADVSHELRTPLTVLNGYLEMMSDMELPSSRNKAIYQMDSQSKRMTMLVNDLIELSKLESVSSERKGEWFSFTQLCHEVIDQLRDFAEGHIIMDDRAKAEVEGFPDEIRSILTNLLTNALKYGGGKDVTLKIHTSMKGLKVSVIDQGDGIPAEHINRITERFYRVDESRESEIGGSGLGLAIVKHALEHHDATLQIDSIVGEGSTFSFVIPTYRVR